MSEKLDKLLPCPCGDQAELHEWNENDAHRWGARIQCNCGWQGPCGYADNRMGCFDAVNDLHKHRAIAAWNKRSTGVLQSSDELVSRTPSERAAYREGVKDGKMYAVRDGLTREDVGLKPLKGNA